MKYRSTFWHDLARHHLPQYAWALEEIDDYASLDVLVQELSAIVEQPSILLRSQLLTHTYELARVHGSPVSTVTTMASHDPELAIWCVLRAAFFWQGEMINPYENVRRLWRTRQFRSFQLEGNDPNGETAHQTRWLLYACLLLLEQNQSWMIETCAAGIYARLRAYCKISQDTQTAFWKFFLESILSYPPAAEEIADAPDDVVDRTCADLLLRLRVDPERAGLPPWA